MAVAKRKRNMTPTRYKALRSTASIQSAQSTVERIFGLPRGSVRLIYPSGRKAYSNSTVGALLTRWAK